MKYGVVFPQTEYGNDPQAIKDYAQTAEGLGTTIYSSTTTCSAPTRTASPGLPALIPTPTPSTNPWCCSASWPR